MMNQKTKSKVLDDVAQQFHQKDIDLSSRILSQVQKNKVKVMNTKIAFTVAIAVVCTVAILFTFPTTAAAMMRILKYIPGIGIVNDIENMRVLEDPVKIQRDDTSITVLQGVIDLQNTTLIYQVENLPDFPNILEFQNSDVCHQLPKLMLPDGSTLNGESESGKSWLSGYNRRIVFPALPSDIKTATLVFPCIERSLFLPDSQKWEIQLDFIPATKETAMYAIVDLPTPEPSSSPSAAPEVSNLHDIQLTVNRYVETDKNLILFGSISSLSGNTHVEGFEKSAIHLVDSRGMEIPLSEDQTFVSSPNLTTDKNSHQWKYQTEGGYESGQATLTLDSALIRVDDIAQIQVNVGYSPQPGQKIMIGESVNIAGYEIQIQNAEINSNGDGLIFTINKPEEISGITLMDFDHPLLGGGGYETYDFTYQDGLPLGEINVTVVSALVQITGPWKTQVDLPTSNYAVTALENSSVCFSQSSWQNALDESPSLPVGLGGTLGINTYMAPDFLYRVMISNLDGSSQEIISSGDGISLSPDGQQIIYNTNTGLILTNLISKTTSPLTDTGKNDRGVVWSPDSKKIAFTRGPSSGLIGGFGPYSIIIANPDGTDQVAVVDDGEANTVFAWHPDGQSLIFTVTGSEGASIRSINLSTGQVTPLISTNYSNTTVALSPDGKRIAYEEMIAGENYAIYIANMDDLSNPRLVVDAAPVVVTRPFWSPDGKWLIASVYDESLSDEMGYLTLLNVDSCQITPLLNFSGYVTSWNP